MVARTAGGAQGQHAQSRRGDAQVIDHILGLWALGSLIQTTLGDQIGRADAPPVVLQARARWITICRLSVWVRGRFASQRV